MRINSGVTSRPRPAPVDPIRSPPAAPIKNSNMCNLTFRPESLGEHRRDFRSGKFDRERQALAQPTPHFGAAQGQAVFRPVTAAPLTRQRPAAPAVIDLIKEQRLNAESVARQRLQKPVSVVGSGVF